MPCGYLLTGTRPFVSPGRCGQVLAPLAQPCAEHKAPPQFPHQTGGLRETMAGLHDNQRHNIIPGPNRLHWPERACRSACRKTNPPIPQHAGVRPNDACTLPIRHARGQRRPQHDENTGRATSVDGKIRRGAPGAKTYPIREHWKGQPPARICLLRRPARARVSPPPISWSLSPNPAAA